MWGEDYFAAGGPVMRDLFQNDDGGWLQDVGLSTVSSPRSSTAMSQGVRAEGWKWVEVATDFPYGHTYGLRHRVASASLRPEKETATRDALRAEAESSRTTSRRARTKSPRRSIAPLRDRNRDRGDRTAPRQL